MRLGEIIQEYRGWKNLSMEEFAKKAGITKGYVSMLEHGHTPNASGEVDPSLGTLRGCAAAMGLSLSQLAAALEDEEEEIKWEKTR